MKKKEENTLAKFQRKIVSLRKTVQEEEGDCDL